MAVFLTVTLIDMLASGKTDLHWTLLVHFVRESVSAVVHSPVAKSLCN
jgi:cell volume regulation protein A